MCYFERTVWLCSCQRGAHCPKAADRIPSGQHLLHPADSIYKFQNRRAPCEERVRWLGMSAEASRECRNTTVKWGPGPTVLREQGFNCFVCSRQCICKGRNREA